MFINLSITQNQVEQTHRDSCFHSKAPSLSFSLVDCPFTSLSFPSCLWIAAVVARNGIWILFTTTKNSRLRNQTQRSDVMSVCLVIDILHSVSVLWTAHTYTHIFNLTKLIQPKYKCNHISKYSHTLLPHASIICVKCIQLTHASKIGKQANLFHLI